MPTSEYEVTIKEVTDSGATEVEVRQVLRITAAPGMIAAAVRRFADDIDPPPAKTPIYRDARDRP